MILEGLCTTQNADGSVNLAPMGPVVNSELTRFVFRPFQTSRTFQNLQRHRQGVFHVVDDVLLLAEAALGTPSVAPHYRPALKIEGHVLSDACRWYEFTVSAIDASQPRTEVETQLLHVGHLRDSFGFNRAKHAVIEATILATRLHILTQQEIEQQWPWLQSAVDKTGGEQERRALQFVARHIEDYYRVQETRSR